MAIGGWIINYFFEIVLLEKRWIITTKHSLRANASTEKLQYIIVNCHENPFN